MRCKLRLAVMILALLAVALTIGQARPLQTMAQSATMSATTDATMVGTVASTPAPNTLGAPCGDSASFATAIATAAVAAPTQVGAAQGPVYNFGLTPWQRGQ